MKIAYIFSANISRNDGVTKKVTAQINAWRSLGNEVIAIGLDLGGDQASRNDFFYKIQDGKLGKLNRIFYFLRIYKILKSANVDLVYMRFQPFMPFMGKILKKFPVILEVNSNDVEETKAFKNSSLWSFFRYYYNNLTRNLIFRRASGLVFVTYELSTSKFFAFKKPSIVIPNAINLDQFKTLKEERVETRIPRLVFIGTPNQPWHGIDKIINLAGATVGKLEFWVIGGENRELYENQTENVRFFPYLTGPDLEATLRKCDIAIGTMALHRKGMNEACPLKIRDYLGYGFPIIIGYKDTAWMNCPEPNFVLTIENNEDNLKNYRDSIVNFSQTNLNQIVHKKDVLPFIDILNWERKRLEFFSNQLI